MNNRKYLIFSKNYHFIDTFTFKNIMASLVAERKNKYVNFTTMYIFIL
jgi:hypothetical protein